MSFLLKAIALIALGIFIFYACENKAKSIETPLEIANAIRKNNIKAIATWLENGGNPNQTIDGTYPLYIAAGPKSGFEMLKLLIENGANVNHGAGDYTPLMNAASWTDLQAVELLLTNGADKNLRTERGETAYDVIGNCGDCPEFSQLQKLLKTTVK